MNELIKWNKARQAIIEAKSIDEVKAIRDKAEALRAYAKQAGESLKSQNDLCEIKLRAERRAGEMLKEDPDVQPGRKRLHDVTIKKKYDIEKHESHRWQKIADISEKRFEGLINEIDKEKEELTETFIINSQKKIEREVRIQEQEKGIKNGSIELPKGKYEVIVIDPPWNYGRKYDPNGSRVANPYPEMSLEKLENLNLPSSKNCFLWLWATHQFIWDAKVLLQKWGFEYKAIMVWDKEKMGMGSWLRMQCEFCLFGVKGNPILKGRDVRDIIREPRTSHSTKPETLYKIIDKNCIGRKLDYFARKKREGWDVYGDEVK